MKLGLIFLTVILPSIAFSLPPIIHLDAATVRGTSNGSITKYLGIPFAVAPRFELPIPVQTYEGKINASSYGPACPQQLTVVPSQIPILIPPITFQSEDCLSINVFVPSGTIPDAKLPVAVNIFGGGFEIGNAESNDDTIIRIVARSIEQGLPIIQVSFNYRVSAYGFLASKEIADKMLGNIGLFDQRVALRWVQKHIKSFGGDPSKVVIYGSSSGAISATLQVLAFGGETENLFRGAFMQSGAVLPIASLENGQVYYDEIVRSTGCGNSSNTLQCIRQVPFEALKAAVDKTPNIFDYQSLKLAWLPRIDGIFLQESSYAQIKSGKVPRNIPVVSGNSDDEGTVFSFSQSNVSTEQDFRTYIKTIWFPTASDEELSPLWSNYTSNAADGSPFGTGDANQLYPQYKRIVAFQGDVVFQSQRRFFLENLPVKQKKWAYLSKVFKSTPFIGSFHGTEVASNFLDDYFINFVNNLDPNIGSTTGQLWPEYTTQSPNIFTFNDSAVRFVSQDTYRAEAMQCVLDLAMAHPI